MLPVVKFPYLNILIAVGIIRNILGDCEIDFPVDPSLRPTYYKYVGSHKLKIDTNSDKVLLIHEGQKFEAHCYNDFEEPSFYQRLNKLNIRCRGSSVYTTDSYRGNEQNYYGRPTFECSFSKWNLYESSDNFSWCPSNVTSYILARPEPSHILEETISSFINLAGICYDIYNFSFYSVYYTLAPKTIEYAEPLTLASFYKPGLELNYIEETFKSNSISKNIYDHYQVVDWITGARYEFNLIIQHRRLSFAIHDKFAPLLEILWWRNLRLYNWNRYIQALEKHVEDDNKIYDILAGVSGTLKAPIMEDCSQSYALKELVFNGNRHIPLYVWNYLQDSSNSSNEIVIIGFNSPFNEFYSQGDIVFCPDKCEEITWLRKVSSSFRYGIMGIVFCCDVEDVRLSKRLYGFPENDIKQRPAVAFTNFIYETTELSDYE